MDIKIIIGILAVFLFVATATASVQVSPSLIVINLVAGDSVTENITIVSDTSGWCSITTTISPDGEGINITYIVDDPFYIEKNVEYIVPMRINTSILLKPDTYTIETTFTVTTEVPDDKPSRGHFSPTVVVNSKTPDEPDGNGIEPLDEPDDGNDEEPIVSSPKKPEGGLLSYFLLLFGLICLFLLVTLLILYKKRGNKKNERNENK